MPLAFHGMASSTQEFIRVSLWALVMWGPGLGAIIATTWVAKEPFSTLRLNTLGAKRFYFWALLLPAIFVIAAGALTVLFGIAKFDPEFNFIRESMKNTPGAANVNPLIVISAQAAFAILLAQFLTCYLPSAKSLAGAAFCFLVCCHLGSGKRSLSQESFGKSGMHSDSTGIKLSWLSNCLHLYDDRILCVAGNHSELVVSQYPKSMDNGSGSWSSQRSGRVASTLFEAGFQYSNRRHTGHISGVDHHNNFHRMAGRVETVAGKDAEK